MGSSFEWIVTTVAIHPGEYSSRFAPLKVMTLWRPDAPRSDRAEKLSRVAITVVWTVRIIDLFRGLKSFDEQEQTSSNGAEAHFLGPPRRRPTKDM